MLSQTLSRQRDYLSSDQREAEFANTLRTIAASLLPRPPDHFKSRPTRKPCRAGVEPVWTSLGLLRGNFFSYYETAVRFNAAIAARIAAY